MMVVKNKKQYLSEKLPYILIFVVVSIILMRIILSIIQQLIMAPSSIDDYHSSLYIVDGNVSLQIKSKPSNKILKEYAIDHNSIVSGYLYEIDKNKYILNFLYKRSRDDVEYIKLTYMGESIQYNIDAYDEDYILISDIFISKDLHNSNNLIIEEIELNANYEVYKKDGAVLNFGTCSIYE